MGFSSTLQGKSAHEALLGRQDAEIRLMDTMRRCLLLRAKCDREYAAALSSVSTQGLRGAMENQELLAGSVILKAWRNSMEEIENFGRLIRHNADQLEGEAVKQLNKLQVDQRKNRKEFRDEYLRITTMFTQLSEDVARKKGEYHKSLEAYKLLRSRFEDHYIKAGRCGRKLEEMCEKYQKACRKLHLTHNEYVLLLSEVREFEFDYRTVLLPGLLEYQQTVQEAAIKHWQTILMDAFQICNLSSDKFQEIEKKLETDIQAIQPSEEYKEFIEKHKTEPNTAVPFSFDESLLEDISGKLLPNIVAVDNLTIDWLRNKVTELEDRLHEQQTLAKEKEMVLKHEKVGLNRNSSASSLKQTHLDNQSNSTQGNADFHLPSLLRIQREVGELRCCERKLKKLVEMIKAPLTDLGCEEAPPGCDISLSLNILTPGILDSNAETVSNQDTESQNKSESSLFDEEWFHGCLPREDVVRLLNQDGDFLVRETIRNDERQTVLSVNWCGPKHFIVQTTPEGHFRFEGPAFATIQELITHQLQSGLPVTARSGAILRKPVVRERWELNNDDVILESKIGRGNFGDVYKAHLKGNNEEVAVKTCRMTLPEEQKRKFLQEGRILKQYDHPNVVKFIGICVQKQPIMIVMELVPGGSLLTYLRKHAAFLPLKQLLSMCRDVAAGMKYLESKNCIHRDLAARNCLVGHNNIVKISDFGMSREEEEYIVSDGMKQIPIKWTAPEALNFGKYTSLCDVWSYGVLAWEIFACGGTPYPGLSNSKAREKIDSGYRMPAPEGTPPELYELMLHCWEYDPEKRPHFDEIYRLVDEICSTN